MKINYQVVIKVKRALERTEIEFSPKNIGKIVQIVHEETRVSKKIIQHILCCGSVIETSSSWQYCLPSTTACLNLRNGAFETKLTYFDTTKEDSDSNYEREEEFDLNGIFCSI